MRSCLRPPDNIATEDESPSPGCPTPTHEHVRIVPNLLVGTDPLDSSPPELLRRFHARCPIRVIRTPDAWVGRSLRNITLQGFRVQSIDWTVALIDKDPNGIKSWPPLEVVLGCQGDIERLRGELKGPRSWKRLCRDVCLSDGTIVPEGFGLSSSALDEAKTGEMLRFTWMRFDVFPGQYSSVSTNDHIFLLCRKRAIMEVVVHAQEQVNSLQAALAWGSDGRWVLVNEVEIGVAKGEVVQLLRGFELVGGMNPSTIQPGAGLRFAYNPELRLKRMLDLEGFACVDGYLDVDCFKFRHDLFDDVAERALGPPGSIRGSSALDLRNRYGFGLLGLATPQTGNVYSMEWAPGPNSRVRAGSFGLVLCKPSAIAGLSAEAALHADDLSEVAEDLNASGQSALPQQNEHILAEHYILGDTIGQGGTGKVYEAKHRDTGQIVAMKEILLMTEMRDEIRELQIYMQLSHPRIVQYFGHDLLPGTDGGPERLFLVLEYCAGGSIHSQLKAYGPLQESLVKHHAQQLLEGLSYLHTQSFVHRDLKCANLLLTHDANLKIADFGCSKLVQHGGVMKEHHTTVGTLMWMAPESYQSEWTLAADIWGVGCCILEMVMAKHPWSMNNVDNEFNFLRIFTMTEAVPNMPPDMHPLLADLTQRCLLRDPKERASIVELQEHPFFLHPMLRGNSLRNSSSNVLAQVAAMA